MYGKVFKQMYRGSLVEAGWEAVVTMQQLIVLADDEGVVDMTPEAISRETTIPLEIIRRGLSQLELPDPNSRTPDEEGRRIVRLSESRSWGWRLVNYVRYRGMASEAGRRDYHRTYWRENRSAAARLNKTQQTLNLSQPDSRQEEEEEEEKESKSKAAAQPAGAARCPFDACVDAMQAKGTAKAAAYATIGKLKKALGADEAWVVASRAIDQSDPRSWLWAAIKQKEKRGESFNPASYEESLP